MSRTIRRNVTALALAGILATAAQPVAARAFTSSRPSPAPRTSLAAMLTAGATGSLDRAEAWLHQLWLKATGLFDSTTTTAPPPPPSCGSSCPSNDEGPIIDPNGGGTPH